MSLISSSVIDEIKQLNVVDIISKYVDLIKRGNNTYVGLCPFHMEKTPSFTVYESRGSYKCYGCQVFGDSIKFIQEYKKLDFQNSIIYICENFGIDIKYDSVGNSRPLSLLKAIHEDIALFAKEQLYSTAGKESLDYLYNRGFSKELINYFDIGFFPSNKLPTEVIKNYDTKLLLESGIFYNTRFGLKSFFENRILFPIRSYTGSCIGFSGRSLDPMDKAKYKNSPETPLFSKRRELYNLHNAKDAMLESKSCYIVEGYFDVMRMVENGYKNTVAIMGTAFTKEQVHKLKSYVEEYNIILDGDIAGIKAAKDSIKVSLDADIYPYVAFLPKGEDPDSLIKKSGIEIMNTILESKKDLLLHTIEEEYKLVTDINKKFYRFNDIKKILEKVPNVYRRSYYSDRAAEIFSIDRKDMDRDILEKNIVSKRKSSSNTVNYLHEEYFLSALYSLDDELVFKLIYDMSPEYFISDIARGLFMGIQNHFTSYGSLSNLISDESIPEVSLSILAREINTSDLYRTTLENKIKLILNYTNKERINNINNIALTKESDLKQEFIIKHYDLLKKIKLLKEELDSISTGGEDE